MTKWTTFLCLALFCGAIACDGGQAPGPQGKRLVELVRADLAQLGQALATSSTALDPKVGMTQALGAGLSGLQGSREGLYEAAAILDSQGRHQCRVLATQQGAQSCRLQDSYDYSRYGTLMAGPKKGKISHTVLYLPDRRVYVVCAPVSRQGRLQAVICLACQPDAIEKKFGMRPEDFLALEF